jgi:hypothetical protein
MYRCAAALLGAALIALPAAAQLARQFPPTALRGEMIVGAPPQVTLNGEPARLSPGARIRGQNNMLELSASLSGKPLLVHYTLNTGGELQDVWVLRPDELAKQPWPVRAEQAQRWSFDPIAQVWTVR